MVILLQIVVILIQIVVIFVKKWLFSSKGVINQEKVVIVAIVVDSEQKS